MEKDSLLLKGANILSAGGPFIGTILLLLAVKQGPKDDKPFWLFMSIGHFCYLVAELIWAWYESVQGAEVPFPGSPDIFYMLQIIFYSTAFAFKIIKEKKPLHATRLLFDVAIVLVVATTFSWHFLIEPIVSSPEATGLFLFVSIGYPVGDLALLLGGSAILLGGTINLRLNQSFIFILAGLLMQIFADSGYLYLLASDQYDTGSFVDPLFTLALLLIGYSGVYAKDQVTVYSDKDLPVYSQADGLRVSLPYITVMGLLIFLLSQNRMFTGVAIGCSIAILLVLIRQIIVLRENDRLMSSLNYLAYHDALTGLANRKQMERRMERAIEDAKRQGSMIAVLYIDLDRFKVINDLLGHKAGDELLVQVANKLKACMRSQVIVARQGGDEFCVLAEGIGSLADAEATGQAVYESLRGVYRIGGRELKVTPSIGISVYPRDGEVPDTLLKNADIAMYRAKRSGKDRCSLYNTELDTEFSKRIGVEADLPYALDNGQFIVYYQPIMDAGNHVIRGYEALLRWEHPSLGLIAPGMFIPIAEETGYILPIGEWVMETACQQAKAWEEAGQPLKIAVNISPKQFHQENLISLIDAILKRTGLDASRLELEITEAVAMSEMKDVIGKLGDLKKLGVQIAIDDFGTGYSSLSYLAVLPIDTLKIAREFIREIGNNRASEAIISSIITLAKNLNLQVVAEGVETKEQLDFLSRENCDLAQGYLIGKPAPIARSSS